MSRPDPVAEYLARLDEAAGVLPAAQRRELRAELQEHLREAAAEDELRDALERLGDPAEIVAEQLRGVPAPGPPSVGRQQWGAIVLLLAGGFLAGVGWIVGVALLWSSRAWSVREKLVGTLIVPGGLAGAFVLLASGFGGETCTSGGLHAVERCTGATTVPERVAAILLFVTLLVAPVVTAIFLALRARPRAA